LRDGLGIVVVVWSVALFVIVRTPERVALAMVIGVFCLAPWGLSEIERRMAIDSSPGMRALDHLAAGRLSSTLFADLGTLDAQLRDENAVKAVVADVHRRLGQWESARRLYTELAEAEPNNASPILGLGAYHFAKNDFKRAVEQFLRAVEVDPRSVEAFFNLSQSYGSAYLFEDSRSALARATAIAPDRVGQWVNSPPIERLVVPDPVVVRRAEIEMALTDRRPTATFGRIALWAWSLISWFLLVAIAIAAATAWSRRPRGREAADNDLGPFERLPPLWTAVLPGAVSTAKGRPVLGWLAWVPFALGIALAAGSRWTPVPSSPMVSSSTLALVAAILGLGIWIALRWFWALREET
jgi:tetratricopeptide (TPR) repeat protein